MSRGKYFTVAHRLQIAHNLQAGRHAGEMHYVISSIYPAKTSLSHLKKQK